MHLISTVAVSVKNRVWAITYNFKFRSVTHRTDFLELGALDS